MKKAATAHRSAIVRLVLAGAAFLAAAAAAQSQAPRFRASGAAFDYYLLSLSWAPDFCAAPGGFKDPTECGAGRHVGFIVHGLWPQNNSGRGPEKCSSADHVSSAAIKLTLRYIPSTSLIQHEWKTHGTCSGLGADAYFAALRRARDAVTIPLAFASLSKTLNESPAQVQQQFAAANPTYIPTSIRATCTGGALQEVRLCLDKAFAPRACTSSAGGCVASKIRILPPR